MTPAWEADGTLAPLHRQVGSEVTAECPAASATEFERFRNGELSNKMVCLATGQWDRTFDDCERKCCVLSERCFFFFFRFCCVGGGVPFG